MPGSQIGLGRSLTTRTMSKDRVTTYLVREGVVPIKESTDHAFNVTGAVTIWENIA